MSQKLSINHLEWIEDTSQFNKDFLENYNEESDEGYFLEDDAHYLKKLLDLHNDLPILPEEMKIENLVGNLHDKTEYVLYTPYIKSWISFEKSS